MELFFVTSNENKLREVQAILEFPLRQIELDIPEIQSLDVCEVVQDKALRAFQKVGKPVVVEDTGLYIHGLNGFPGALVKWVLKTVGASWLCRGVSRDRSAHAKTAVCFCNGKNFEIFTGEIQGEISFESQGASGFGWDSIFIPKGCSETFAEMPMEAKNSISMRRIAFLKMKSHFNGFTLTK